MAARLATRVGDLGARVWGQTGLPLPVCPGAQVPATTEDPPSTLHSRSEALARVEGGGLGPTKEPISGVGGMIRPHVSLGQGPLTQPASTLALSSHSLHLPAGGPVHPPAV